MRIINKFPLVADQILGKTIFGGISFASVAVIVMFLLVMAEIIARKVFNATTYVSGELTEYCLVAIIMFALADLLKKRQHLTVGIITEKLPQRIRDVADFIFSKVIFLLYCAFLTFICFRLVWESYKLHVVTASITHTPIWIPQSMIVLGLLILDITLITEIISWFCSKSTKKGEI